MEDQTEFEDFCVIMRETVLTKTVKEVSFSGGLLSSVLMYVFGGVKITEVVSCPELDFVCNLEIKDEMVMSEYMGLIKS